MALLPPLCWTKEVWPLQPSHCAVLPRLFRFSNCPKMKWKHWLHCWPRFLLFSWKTTCTKVTEAFQQQTWEDNISVYLWFMLGKHRSLQWRTKISFAGKHRFSGWWHVAGKLPFFPQHFMNFERHRFLWLLVFLNWPSDVVLCYTNCFRWWC